MDEKKQRLAQVVGNDNLLDDPQTLDMYARDESFVVPRKPRLVVKPKTVDEVQEIVVWANETDTPLVPVSSGPPHFRGDTVPSLGGTVIVDLSEMNRIIRIDRRNRMVMVEPGVTYSQLQPELAKNGMKLSLPLLPRSNKSVVTSLLEREPILTPKYQWSLPDPLRSLEVIWGNGSKLRTGRAGDYRTLEEQWEKKLAQAAAYGPGQIDYHRLFSAAQGTMGIVSWASVRCEILPQLQKLLFIPSQRLDPLIGFAYKLLRFRFCDEFLFLNNSNLAYIFGKEPDEIRALKQKLPPWVLILGIAGRDRLPKDRVEFQQKDVRDIAQQFGLRITSSILGAKTGNILNVLLNPAKEPHWKHQYKGACQDIFFLTTLNRTPEFVSTMYSVSQAHKYSPSEIGIYIQPVQQGVACHCEFNLPFDPGNQEQVANIKELFGEGSREMIKQGAFFSRPYGIWADMAYNRDAQSTILLKKIKQIFDPNNVMNPGKLCF